jgi:hypothetical protein
MPCPIHRRAARLIAKGRFIGQYPPQKLGKKRGSERETAMLGFGKSSIWTAAGFAFVGGLVLLQPTKASAQFNIEGIIRGALQQQGCCYGGSGYYRNRSSGSGTTRHVKSHENDDSAPAPVDKTKERDATQVDGPNNNVASGRQQLSGPPPPPPPPPDTSKQTSAARGNDDQPAFSPSR